MKNQKMFVRGIMTLKPRLVNEDGKTFAVSSVLNSSKVFDENGYTGKKKCEHTMIRVSGESADEFVRDFSKDMCVEVEGVIQNANYIDKFGRPQKDYVLEVHKIANVALDTFENRYSINGMVSSKPEFYTDDDNARRATLTLLSTDGYTNGEYLHRQVVTLTEPEHLERARHLKRGDSLKIDGEIYTFQEPEKECPNSHAIRCDSMEVIAKEKLPEPIRVTSHFAKEKIEIP